MGEWKSRLAGIYMLEFPNGKVYIGKSIHLKKRLLEHKLSKGSSVILKEARQMFEWESIKKVYLETFEVDENTDISALTLILDEKEREYIQKYKSNNIEFGYNQYDGGSNGKGYVCSEEHKKRLRLSHLGKKLPPVSEEVRKKRSDSLKGKRPSPQCEEARLKAITGKKHSPEHRMKMFLNDPRHRKIASYDENSSLVKVYFCLRDAANDAQVPYQGIQRVLNGKRKRCGGLYWKYYEE